MVRPPLTARDRERGKQLGKLLRAARGDRSMVEVASRSGVSVDTLRKIETGRVPTPALFTVAAVAAELDLRLDDLVKATVPEPQDNFGSAGGVSVA